MHNPISISEVTDVDTPLGRLKFYANFITGKVDNITLYQVELEPTLPQGMSVSKSVGVLLRFSVIEEVTEFKFFCDWVGFNGKGYSNTGEALDAWEWNHENYLVVIGTEDAEWLNMRMPLVLFTSNKYPITMEKNKIKIKLDKLPIGHIYSFHFIVAWNSYPEPYESSCWYAVDVPHKKVEQYFINSG
jgi:hypothetical protein